MGVALNETFLEGRSGRALHGHFVFYRGMRKYSRGEPIRGTRNGDDYKSACASTDNGNGDANTIAIADNDATNSGTEPNNERYIRHGVYESCCAVQWYQQQ
jgi:hypothetical protein